MDLNLDRIDHKNLLLLAEQSKDYRDGVTWAVLQVSRLRHALQRHDERFDPKNGEQG